MSRSQCNYKANSAGSTCVQPSFTETCFMAVTAVGVDAGVGAGDRGVGSAGKVPNYEASGLGITVS